MIKKMLGLLYLLFLLGSCSKKNLLSLIPVALDITIISRDTAAIAAGVITTSKGGGLAALTDDIGKDAQFNFPRGLATNPGGNINVADLYNQTVRKITPILQEWPWIFREIFTLPIKIMTG